MVTKEDSLYFAGKVASENLNWRSTEKKEGMVGRVVDAIQDLSARGLTARHMVRDFSIRQISLLRLRSCPLLWYIGCDEATKDTREALSSDETRERVKMICVGEPNAKDTFLGILAVVSEEERPRRLMVDNNFFYLLYILRSIYDSVLICRWSC